MSGLVEDAPEGSAVVSAQRNLDFRWRVEDTFAVVTAAGLLQQILDNLLGNAVRCVRSALRVGAGARRGAFRVLMANDSDGATTAEAVTGLVVRSVRGLAASLDAGGNR